MDARVPASPSGFPQGPVTTDFSPGETRILGELRLLTPLSDYTMRLSENLKHVQASLDKLAISQQEQSRGMENLSGKIDSFMEAQSPLIIKTGFSNMSVGTTESSVKKAGSPLRNKVSATGTANFSSLGASDRARMPLGDGRQISVLSGHSQSEDSKYDSSKLLQHLIEDADPSALRAYDHLPVDWPHCLQIRFIPDAAISMSPAQLLSDRRGSMEVCPSEGSSLQGDDMLSTTRHSVCSGCRGFLSKHVVINPNSTVKVSFEVASIFVLLFDLTVIPFLIAWDMHLQNNFSWIPWFTVSFWSIDICISCITAVAVEGRLQRDPHHIIRKYFRTWMVPDVLIVGSDWLSLITATIYAGSSNSSAVKMLRLLKLGRLLRVIGMLKIFKFARVIEEFMDRAVGETYRMSLKILSMIFTVTWVNHIICCGWFMLGRMSVTDTGQHWPEAALEPSVLEEDILYQYSTTFHWSMSQLTLGASEIVCKNSYERFFNIACLVFGLILSSTLVSSLSATMVQFQMMRNGRAQKLRMLRQFLKDNKVDLDISYLVQKQVKDRLGPTDKLTDQDVPVLSLLSQGLLAELRFQVFKPWLVSHSLFRLWAHQEPMLFSRLCFGMEFIVVRAGDTHFSPGIARAEAYLLTSGQMIYRQRRAAPEREGSPSMEAATAATTSLQVQVNTWLCEPSLWVEWHHVGSAEAAVSSQLLVLSAEVMHHALLTRHPVRRIVAEYAEVYYFRTINAQPPLFEYPNDLTVPETGYADIVLSLNPDHRMLIGIDAIAQGEEKRWFNTGLAALRREVLQGLSTVIVDGSGEVLRLACIVVLRVVNRNTKILVQLAKFDTEAESAWSVKAQLPAVKQVDNETWAQASERLLLSLRSITGKVELTNSAHAVEFKQSPGLGVRTKYLRTTCTGHQVQSEESEQDDKDTNLPTSTGSMLMLTQTHSLQLRRMSAFGSKGGSRGGGSSVADPLGLDDEEVYLCGRNGKVYFYTWLAQLQFEELSSGKWNELLTSGLQSIDFDPEDFSVMSKVNSPEPGSPMSNLGGRNQSKPSMTFHTGSEASSLVNSSSQPPSASQSDPTASGAATGTGSGEQAVDVHVDWSPRDVLNPFQESPVQSRLVEDYPQPPSTKGQTGRMPSPLRSEQQIPELSVDVIASRGKWYREEDL